ncbi:choice-of-anchor D domain-containing protein [Streptomyces acidiscabies]|uniref:Choice-of-anchor D domain-containing protein n=2 Tax=Streptomyces acidiscabies TaxID=42234 RepID=A0ABU4M694_9ACTN|nr:choice-of-anchor D domain-containing protein [Streptomyces acidiscabies]MBP5939122.1 choice-of-anchor D domain-containing protein [Streptomyces sp. LBUM 1476]MDX3023591.1 choice-of-anchor D domain-containing protein [Streptomyces acidiscabies]GAV43947.1 hypothetical protein Saa2_06906 [Streptomyces acidiscabies]
MNSVVFGNLSVSLTGRHGARLTRVPPSVTTPYPRALAEPPQRPYLVGRSGELDRVRARETVEFTGPCGSGRTALLRSVPDSVYVRAGATALEDLLQDLMRSYYVWQGPVRFTTEECARALGAVDGTVALDDVTYTAAQLGYLQQVLRGCVLVLATGTPTLPEAHALEGLSEDAATALLARDLGRPLSGPEQAAVGRLVAAVGGQPLHLRQAAALVRYDGMTLADVTARAAGDPGVLDELCVSALAPQAKRVLAVLTLLGGALLPAGVLAQMADVAYVAQTFESLSARGLAEQSDDRFGLPVCKAEPYRHILYRHIGLASAVRSLVTWLASGDPTGPDARGALDAAIGLLGVAAERREWQTVVRLVTVLERVLFIQSHWQAWQNTLAQGITAAREAGDVASEAYFTHQQGVQHFLHDRTEHARRMLQRALDLRTQLGDTAGAEVTRANLALLDGPVVPPMPSTPPRAPSGRGGGRRVAVVAAAVVGVLVVGTAVAQVVGKGGGGGSSGSASVGSAGPVASVSDTESTSPPVSQSVSPSESESVSPGDSGGGGSEPPPLARAGLRLTPSAQDFGRTSRFPSVDAPLRGFLLANTGTTAVTLGSITIPGSNGFSYADGNCGTELAAGASCTITIEFSPGRIGADSGQLTVTSSARTVTADLTGTAYPSVTLTLTGGGRNQVTVSDPRGNPLCTGADDRHNCDPVEAPDSLIPTAAKGTMFSEWLGACTGSGSCSPPQDRDSEVTAVFKPDIR